MIRTAPTHTDPTGSACSTPLSAKRYKRPFDRSPEYTRCLRKRGLKVSLMRLRTLSHSADLLNLVTLRFFAIP